jgi:hypothetical protein
VKRLQRLLVLSHKLRVNLPKAGQPSHEGLATRHHREVFIHVKKIPPIVSIRAPKSGI